MHKKFFNAKIEIFVIKVSSIFKHFSLYGEVLFACNFIKSYSYLIKIILEQYKRTRRSILGSVLMK